MDTKVGCCNLGVARQETTNRGEDVLALTLSTLHSPESGPRGRQGDFLQGFELVEPCGALSPLVFCSPHSGCVYPPQFLQQSRLDPATLRRSEDAHVDQLFAAMPGLGAPLLRAHFPRAYLDVNREPYELDPRMFDGRLPAFANTRSLRVTGGLGTIARIVGEGQEIYARRLSVPEALMRIENLYRPFHRRLRQVLDRAGERFGHCLLVDCHSMPSTAALCDEHGRAVEQKLRADFVLGDRFGTSCHPEIVDLIDYELRRMGYAVARNKPYAGGFITEHYGHPRSGRSAVQIEINRALYMNERTLEITAGFARLARDMAGLGQSLTEYMLAGQGMQRVAAE